MPANDLVYVVHPDPKVAARVSAALLASEYKVLTMTTEAEAEDVLNGHQFVLPDAILTPLGDLESGDSILIRLYASNPLMEQIPLVVLASEERDQRRKALRMGLLSVIFPPYDQEEVSLTTKLAIDKHRKESLLFGSLAQLSVPDLLQTAEVGRRSGTIAFRYNSCRGAIWLRDGLIVNAEMDGVNKPEDAAYAIVLWDKGTFEANFRPIDTPERFAIPPSELLLEAMRRLDEGLLPAIDFDGDKKPSVDPREETLDLAVTLMCVATSYALNHLEPDLVNDRCKEVRDTLMKELPQLEALRFADGGLVALDLETEEIDPGPVAAAVAHWIRAFFERLDAALAWRFSPERLTQITGPWHERMHALGFTEPLGIADEDAAQEEEDREADLGDRPLPFGCFVLDDAGEVLCHSAYGSHVRHFDSKALIGQELSSLLPPELAEGTQALFDELTPGDGKWFATKEFSLIQEHEPVTVRIALVRAASRKSTVAVFNRMRDPGRPFSQQIDRNAVSGTLSDGATMRLMLVNDDFLAAIDGLFTKNLQPHRYEILRRLGKEWGLRHALRLECLVQRDYGETLREVESQMALELFSGSIGVLGLGRFEADLSHRDRGLIVLTHFDSPFAGSFARSSTGCSCSVLAGFHAALMSYLAGRQLAAREVFCSLAPNHPCRFVVATEKRLSQLLLANPDSTDHALLQELKQVPAGGNQRKLQR